MPATGLPLTLPITNPVLIFALAMVIFLVAPVVFERLRIPGIIGLILAGLVVGPHGLILSGLEGSIRYEEAAGHQYTQEQMDRRVAQLAVKLLPNRLRYGRYLDIFVAHSPPLGVGDGPDPAHVGFRAFMSLIEKFKPRLMLHGHQHRYYGPYGVPPSTQVGATRVINVYPYQVIDWEDEHDR